MGLGLGVEKDKLQNNKGCRMKRPLEEKDEEKDEEKEAAAAEIKAQENEAEPKRVCSEGSNSEIDEFFILLKRIESTEKMNRDRKGMENQKRIVNREPLWRPAFVWEDFCRDGNGNRTRDVESKPEEEANKDEILQDKDNKNDDDSSKNTLDFLNREQSPSADPNNEGRGIEKFDLNMPSEAMQLFF